MISKAIAYLLILSCSLAVAAMVDDRLSPPIDQKYLQNTDIIVEGTFSVDTARFVSDKYNSPLGYSIDGSSATLSFSILSAIKGDAKGTIPVKLFFPSGQSLMKWALPLRERILIFLKKDSSPNGPYTMVAPQDSWLALANNETLVPTDTNLNDIIGAKALSFLKYKSANKSDIEYCVPDTKGNMTFFTSQGNDPSTIQALDIIQSLNITNSSAMSIVQLYSDQPGIVGDRARTILAKQGGINVISDRLNDYLSGKLTQADAFNFPFELSKVIETQSLGEVMPLVTSALASHDDRIKIAIVSALHNKNDPKLYVVLEPLLKDSNMDVQYQAIMRIYEISGDPSLKVPTNKIFKSNPSIYINMYTDWYAKNAAALKSLQN